MNFKQTVMFLGMKPRVGNNGVSFVVDLFCPGDDTWKFFLKEGKENHDLISFFQRCNCGSMVDASFVVGKYSDKTYVRLTDVEDAA